MMRAGAGVGEDPADLLGGGRLVDRDGDRAGGPDREVGQGPLVAGLAHQRDAVPGPDARGDHALGHRADVVVELPGRHLDPAAALLAGERDRRRVGRRVAGGKVGESCPRSWGDEWGCDVFLHGVSFDEGGCLRRSYRGVSRARRPDGRPRTGSRSWLAQTPLRLDDPRSRNADRCHEHAGSTSSTRRSSGAAPGRRSGRRSRDPRWVAPGLAAPRARRGARPRGPRASGGP